MEDKYKILNSLVNVAPYLKNYFIEDFWVAVTSKEEIIAYEPGDSITSDVLEVGQELKDEWVVTQAIKKNQRVIEEKDASVLGIPYIGIGSPVYDPSGNEIVGGVAIVQATDRKEKLLKVANNLSEYTEDFSGTLENISAEAEEMSATGQELNSISENVKNKVQKSTEIIELIEQVAEDINMIGLNAKIEAARLGDEGRGFGVVAEEVQRLANSTSSSVDDIDKSLKSLISATNNLAEAANQVSQISTDQAEKLMDMNEKIENMVKLSSDVVDMANNLSKD